MGHVEGLIIAGAQSAGLAVLAVLFFQAYRRVGILPFLAFLGMLAALVPFTAHHPVLEVGAWGSLSVSQIVVAPVVIACVVLLHLMRGWRNAQIMAGVSALAGVGVALSVALSRFSDVWIASGALPSTVGVPLGAGVAVWLGAACASGALWGLFRLDPSFPALGGVSVACVAGVGVHALSVISAAYGGGAVAGVTWVGAFMLPLLGGFSGMLVVSVYAAMQVADLWPQTRQALTSREPIGTRSQVDDALVLQDEFQRERAQEQEQADTLKQLVEEADHGAYVCTPEGRVTYANQGLSRLLDQPDRSLEGENIRHVFGGRDAKGRPRFASFPVKPGRHRATIQLPSGQKRAIEITVQPTDEGRMYGRVLDRTEEVLRERVEKQKERAEFYVDLLRHDIGNYVMTPLSYLQVLERREDLGEEAREFVEASRVAVEDIADLLGRIDVLSDVDSLKAEPTDAAKVLRSVGASATRQHGDITVRYALPEGPVPVAGTPMLEEVFGNLVGNAVRHAGSDAIVELGANQEGAVWELWVADNGEGVPEEDKETIFDRTHHDKSAGGKGLGLYIVKTIMEALKGEVWVEDRVKGNPSEGACFKVKLKAVGPEALEDMDDVGKGSPGEGAAPA